MTMRHFWNALILIISLILQSTVAHFLGIMGVIPNILLAGAVSIALCAESGLEALLYGLGAGVIYDIAWGRIFGVHALLMMYIAVGVYFASDFVYKKNITVCVLFAFLASLIHDIIFFAGSFMLFGNGQFLYVLFRIIIPAAAYTAFIQIFVYMLVRKVNRRGEEV